MTRHVSGGGPQKEGRDPHVDIINRLLRDAYKFDGVVCTDWGLITDLPVGPVTWPAPGASKN